MPVPTYDPEDIAATCLKRTMLGIAAITAITPNIDIVLWGQPDETAPMPFTILEYFRGGWEKDEMVTNTADVWIKAAIRTTDIVVAEAYRAALASLHQATLIVSDFTNVSPYAKIYLESSVREYDPAQNIPIYKVGGIYSIRFVAN